MTQIKHREIKRLNDEIFFEFAISNPEEIKKRGKIPHPSKLFNSINEFFYNYLNGFNIPLNFIKKHDDVSCQIKEAENLPFKVIIRNYATAEFSKIYSVDLHEEFAAPIYDFFFTDKRFESQLINESYICAFGYMQAEEMKLFIKYMSKVNALLKSYFNRRSVNLAEFELHCAIHKGNILISGEFSPQTISVFCRGSEKRKYSFDSDYSMALYDFAIGL